jgi:hypothetical protein
VSLQRLDALRRSQLGRSTHQPTAGHSGDVHDVRHQLTDSDPAAVAEAKGADDVDVKWSFGGGRQPTDATVSRQSESTYAIRHYQQRTHDKVKAVCYCQIA